MLLCAEYVIPITADPIEAGAVLVRDGKIADIGPAAQLRLRYAAEEVRDFGQAALLPGFVDAHAHLEFTVLHGLISDKPYAEWLEEVSDLSATLPSATLYDSAVLGGMEMLQGGITATSCTTTSESALFALRDLGLRGTVYREVGAMDARRIDYAMRSACEDIEYWESKVDPGRLRIGIAAAALHICHPEVLTRVSAFAGDRYPVALHLAGSREEESFIRSGRSPFAVDAMPRSAYVEVPPWLPTGATPVNYALNWRAFDAKEVMVVHGVHVTDDDIQQLRAYDVSVVICPRTNALLGMGVAPVGAYLRAGMTLGLGTDSPAATDSSDMFNEMRTALQVQRSSDATMFLTSREVLEMATIGGARLLGIDDKVGSLEVGKQADMCVLDLSGSRVLPAADPVATVVHSGSAANVVLTMVGGDVLYDNGTWNVRADYAAALASLVKTRTRLRVLQERA